MNTTTPKLHAALAHAGVASRRKVEAMILAGKVSVNGAIATIGQRVDPNKDKVTVDGKSIQLAEAAHRLFLVYKPFGIVSTTQDELGRTTVLDYFHKEVAKRQPELARTLESLRLYPVGRLDKESAGLMLLTNDGALTHTYTHPSFESKKTYHVTVDGSPSAKALDHLARGVKLREGYTAPAEVEVLKQGSDETVLEMTIHEGKYQQIRRMCERVGYPVTKLIRTRIGEYTVADLDGASYTEIIQ